MAEALHAREDDREFVNSLARGLAVIQAFARGPSEMSLSEVAACTGLSRAAARRFLLTLERLGYVCTDGRRFRLAPKILDLGFAYLASMDLWHAAAPAMEEVSEALQESCSVAVIEGTDVVYVARIPTRRIATLPLNLGARLPAFCTSLGRVLLAHLPRDKSVLRLRQCDKPALTARTVTDADALIRIVDDVRQAGWALVDQELEEGLRSISVPLRTARGRVVAAMNVSTQASRTTTEAMVATFLPRLRAAADRIAQVLPA